ncbi:N-acetylglucosaminyl-phosphatidylinositol de-N-acetylase [Nymphon striatum]|nr:N-acetylglucosaminyl-phosphatidylinositol de-N-acetylase [Nymphon striatum]
MFGIVTVSAVTLSLSALFHAIVTIFKPSASSKAVKRARRVLILSAHPDDECMFFGPSIRSFILGGCEVHLLCLSSGDYDRLGHLRKQELYKSCEIIGIRKCNVTLIQHSKLEDDPSMTWQEDIVGHIALKYIKQLSIDTVITFDGGGVSGHPNHISCNKGMVYIVKNELLPSNCTVLTLVSVNKFRKYCGMLDIPYSYFSNEHTLISNYDSIFTCQKAMKAHWSQLVWFRWLYIMFSSYMIVNTLQNLEVKSDDTYDDSLLYKLQ